VERDALCEGRAVDPFMSDVIETARVLPWTSASNVIAASIVLLCGDAHHSASPEWRLRCSRSGNLDPPPETTPFRTLASVGKAEPRLVSRPGPLPIDRPTHSRSAVGREHPTSVLGESLRDNLSAAARHG
jgi:hypothetical protein